MKRFITGVVYAILFVACFAFGFFGARAIHKVIEEQYSPLDLNQDGEITIADYTINRLQGFEIKDIILED